MPFIKNGGLFVATEKSYQLGEAATISLKLMDEPDEYIISGKVVWITPIGSVANQPAGVGVQFNTEYQHLHAKIADYLAGMLESEERTDTI